jgi:hypothetical protein
MPVAELAAGHPGAQNVAEHGLAEEQDHPEKSGAGVQLDERAFRLDVPTSII